MAHPQGVAWLHRRWLVAKILPKPTVDTWHKRFRAAEKQQQKWRSEAEICEALYEQEWTVDGVPDNVPMTVPSTARAIVDEATDHSDFDPNWLTIRTPTYGMTEDAENDAGRIRAFLVAWSSHQMTQANDASPFRDFNKNAYLSGKSVYKVVVDYDNWPEYEEGADPDEMSRVSAERQFYVPIVLRALDPIVVYEDPTIGEKQWVIERYQHEAVEVLSLYEKWLPATGLRTDRDVVLEENISLDLWDCYQIGELKGEKGIWHQVLVGKSEDDKTPATKAVFLPNEPFPYVIKFSGGRQSSGRYEQKARSLLFAAKSLLKAEARRFSQLDAIIQMLAWPTTVVTGPKSRFEFVFGPNVVNYVPMGVKVDTVTPQIPAGPIQSALAVIQAGIERATFGSVIRGSKPPQTTSAAQLAILSGQARMKFGAPKIGHETALREVYEKVLHIVKYVLRDKVTVYQTDDTLEESPTEVVLGPSDIPERPAVQVYIGQDPIEERERQIQSAILLKREGLIDEEEARERAGIKSTAAMRRRRIRDMVLMGSPNILAALGESFILSSGFDFATLTLEKAMRDMLMARQQQAMMQSIMSPQGGANAMGSQPGMSGGTTALGGAPSGPLPTQASATADASMGTV